MLTIAEEFRTGRQPTLCGSHEAESRRYRRAVGKSGKTWLIAIQPNEGDNVYVSGGPNSDGFGGRTLRFTLEDGTIIDLKGPWHTNSDALFQDTGIDVRDKHLTFGCIARERVSCYPETILRDVVYIDQDWTVGEFNRVDEIAQRMADESRETLFCYSQSRGGSHCGPVYPKGKENDQ